MVDPNWLPQSTNTAPDPSYPGAHASISHAAATVLISFFDSNRFERQVTSEALPGVVRSFKTIWDIAAEATLSRVLAGQHFRFDENAGQRLGNDVGDFVFDNYLTRRHHDDRNEDHAKSAPRMDFEIAKACRWRTVPRMMRLTQGTSRSLK